MGTQTINFPAAEPTTLEVGDWPNLAKLARRPSAAMRHRLAAAIAELEVLLGGLGPTEWPDEVLRRRLLGDLEAAGKLIETDQLLEGWQVVYTVREEAIRLYPDARRRALGIALRAQAQEHLTGGRLRTVESLLQPQAAMTAAEVSMAQRMVNDHFKGIYMRACHARTQLFFLPIVLTVVLALMLLVSWDFLTPAFIEHVSPSPGLLIWVYVLGALGALLSATLGAIRGLTRENYMLLLEFRINVTRPLLGAASAAAVVAILDTEFLNLAGSNNGDRPLALAVAIVAGFSERLLTTAITSVIHGSDKK